MADASVGDISSLVSAVNSSLKAATSRLQAQSTASSAKIQEFQKTVRKSPSTLAGNATDIGILARGITRLNVVSTLDKKDNVDFYKFRLTSKGEVGMANVGDDGVRVQIMTKLGSVVADSDTKAGSTHEAYKKMMAGELTMDAGNYTIRVSREKGSAAKGNKNYALQLSAGNYTKDYDTVAQQPKPGDSPYQLSAGQQASISLLSDGASSLSSISYGQSGSQKLMGAFSLFA
jgi:hypothetical protein